MWYLVGIGRDALQARNIDESVIFRFVCLFCHCANRCQLFLWMEKALVPARDVVVDFDSEDVTVLRLAHDAWSIVLRVKGPGGDADVVGPVLAGRGSEGRRCASQNQERGDGKQEEASVGAVNSKHSAPWQMIVHFMRKEKRAVP